MMEFPAAQPHRIGVRVDTASYPACSPRERRGEFLSGPVPSRPASGHPSHLTLVDRGRTEAMLWAPFGTADGEVSEREIRRSGHASTRMAHRVPGALARRRSPVTRSHSRISASAM